MKKINLLFGLFAALLLASCSGEEASADETNETVTEDISLDTTAFLADLKTLEDRIDSNNDLPNEKDLKEAITKFQDYAAIFPEDQKAPDYLLKASDLALTTDQPEKSVKILNRIIEEYPEYGKMEDVMYNKASHLDFELRDTTAAKEAYQKFIDTYPNSVLVEDSKSRIKNIRYSMEELTEMFMSELENGGNDLP